jgi:hypothetical protein
MSNNENRQQQSVQFLPLFSRQHHWTESTQTGLGAQSFKTNETNKKERKTPVLRPIIGSFVAPKFCVAKKHVETCTYKKKYKFVRQNLLPFSLIPVQPFISSFVQFVFVIMHQSKVHDCLGPLRAKNHKNTRERSHSFIHEWLEQFVVRSVPAAAMRAVAVRPPPLHRAVVGSVVVQKAPVQPMKDYWQ